MFEIAKKKRNKELNTYNVGGLAAQEQVKEKTRKGEKH